MRTSPFFLVFRRFEALLQTGKSPTCELLFDWGTTNCTVGALVDLLVQIELFAPATLLLPGKWVCPWREHCLE